MTDPAAPPPPTLPVQPPQPQEPPRRSGNGVLRGVGIGCGIGILLLVLALFGLGQCAINTADRMTRGGALKPGYVPPDPSSHVTVLKPPINANERAADLFLGRSLAVSETAWQSIFAKAGGTYEPVDLVIYRAPQVSTGCGVIDARAGPFYCVRDDRIYVETGFFALLSKMGGGGDFPLGFVLAHEVGHHVQRQIGIAGRAEAAMRTLPQAEALKVSVGLELQADCYAGLWGAEMRRGNHLDPGDIEEGIAAAQAVGDDTVQARAQGYVDPSRFSHGSSAQRIAWFRKGLESNDVEACQPALNGGMPS